MYTVVYLPAMIVLDEVNGNSKINLFSLAVVSRVFQQ